MVCHYHATEYQAHVLQLTQYVHAEHLICPNLLLLTVWGLKQNVARLHTANVILRQSLALE